MNELTYEQKQIVGDIQLELIKAISHLDQNKIWELIVKAYESGNEKQGVQ